MSAGLKFPLISADPPWKPEDPKDHDPAMGGITYDMLDDYEIMALGKYVRALSAPASRLLLWCPGFKSAEGVHTEVIRAWGHRGCTLLFGWVKTYESRHEWPLPEDAIYKGLGHHSQQNLELGWLGVKGSRARAVRNVPQVIHAPVREHSRKPNEVWRPEFMRLYGVLPHLEMFARDRWPGVVTLGNELTGRDIRQDLTDLCHGIVPEGSFSCLYRKADKDGEPGQVVGHPMRCAYCEKGEVRPRQVMVDDCGRILQVVYS